MKYFFQKVHEFSRYSLTTWIHGMSVKQSILRNSNLGFNVTLGTVDQSAKIENFWITGLVRGNQIL